MSEITPLSREIFTKLCGLDISSVRKTYDIPETTFERWSLAIYNHKIPEEFKDAKAFEERMVGLISHKKRGKWKVGNGTDL